LFLDATGAPLDTLPLRRALAPTAHIARLTAGADGMTLYLAVQDGPRGLLFRIRRDGVVLDSFALGPERIGPVVLLPRARALAVGTWREGTDPGSGETAGRVILVSPQLRPRGAPMAVCGAPVRSIVAFQAQGRLYVACADGEIVELDQRLGIVVRRWAIAPAPPVGDSAVGSVPSAGSVARSLSVSDSLVGRDRAAPQACDPSDLALSRNETVLFVLCRGSGRLVYLDRARLAPLDSMTVGEGVGRLIRPPSGGWLLVLGINPSRALRVDPRRHDVIARLDLPGVPQNGALGADGSTAFIVTARLPASDEDPGEKALVTLDVATWTVRAVTRLPWETGEPAVWPADVSPALRWSD
jgi:hypothetical protein